MKRYQWLLNGMAAAALVLGMSHGAAAQVGLTRIDGYIIDENNKPVPGAVVTFERVDIKSGTVKLKADKNGFYADATIQWGDYNMDVYSPDGKTHLYHQDAIHLNSEAVRNTVNLKKAVKVSGNEAISQADADAIMSGAKKASDEQQKVAAINMLLAENADLRKQGKYDEAIPKMEKAVEIDATHDVLFANLADDYMGNKQYDQAIAAYEKAITLQPVPAKQANYVVGIGNAYMREGKMTEANEQFDKAKAMDPEAGKMASYNAAVGLFNEGKIDEALTALDGVIASDPGNANAYYYKGLALLNKATMDPKTNKMIPAPGTVEALQKCIQLDPNGQNAAQAKDILAQIK